MGQLWLFWNPPSLICKLRPYSSSRDKRIHQIIIWEYPISRETWPHIPHPKSSLPSGVSATITSRLVESTLGCLRTSLLFRSTWPLSLWGALSWQCQQSRCRILNMPPIQGMIWLFWSVLSSTGSHWMQDWCVRLATRTFVLVMSGIVALSCWRAIR